MADWVVNASPIIVLARMGRISLFEHVLPNYWVPKAVQEEVAAGGQDTIEAQWVDGLSADRIVACDRIPAEVAAWDLGYGETHVIAFAKHRASCGVVLDDRAARRCAAALSLPLTGTLGILIRACRQGIESDMDALLESAEAAGLRIHKRLKATAIRLAVR